jgi:hypothetical protein
MANLKTDHIFTVMLWLIVSFMLSACSVGITNQQPSPGGCTGEPHKVYC